MGTFLNDTFTDVDATLLQNHVGEIGATWTKHTGWTGDTSINSGRIGAGANVEVHYYSSGIPASPDYDVTCTIYNWNDQTFTLAGVMGRMQVGVNTAYGAFANWDGATARVFLKKFVSGTGTDLSNTVITALATGSSHTLVLRMKDTTLTALWDGAVIVGPLTDTSISAAGRAGIFHSCANTTATTGWHIDSVTATEQDYFYPPLIIPNRNVGPMALRRNFRRADFWTPNVAVVVSDFTGSSVDTTVTVGLTAAGVVGSVGDSSTAVTVGLTASGVVGTSSASTSTDVSVGLTADGSVDELHGAPPLIIPNRYVGPMALRQAYRRTQPWTAPGFESLYVSSVDATVTVGPTAAGVVGTVGDASTTVTVGPTASGVVGTSSASTTTAVTVGLTSTGAVGTSSASTSTAVTVGLTADGVVGTSSASPSTDLTVGLTVSGSVDELHPAPPLQIPNRYVGPMALRQAFRRADWWTPSTFLANDYTGTSVDTNVTVGLTAAGAVGTSSASTSTAITVGLTAAGVVGTSSAGTSTAITVGLTAAGSAGTVGQASTALTVGLTASGVVGTTGAASTALTVGLTADGVVGVVGSADIAITVGLTADGNNPASIAPASSPPMVIPNRYVGPMALRQAFHRTQTWTSTPDTVGITGSSTDTAVTVGPTAAGVVGTSSTASTAITVGLTADGVVGTVGQASSAVTVGLTASGVVGKVSTASTSATVGLTAAGVVGKVSQTTASVTVGLTANGVVGIVSQTTTSVTVGLTADGFIISQFLTGSAFTATVVALTAAGGIQIFTAPQHTVTARAVTIGGSASAVTRTSTADASTHRSNAYGSTRTGVADATTREGTA